MAKAKLTTLLTVLMVLAAALGPTAPHAYADEGGEEKNPLIKLKDLTVAFFNPLEGTVTAVDGSTITSNLTDEDGIRAGMRLKVLRKGAPFLHPLTKEPIGKTETQVGEADVLAATEGGYTLSVLEGDVKAGDTLRLSSTNVRALFYQTPEVDWDLSEEYYRTLEAGGRFELISTGLVSDEVDELIREARDRGARVLLWLGQSTGGGSTVLVQRLYLTADSRMFSEIETMVDAAFLSSLKLGERLIGPVKGDVNVTFRIPFKADLIAAGDVNGDGKDEIAMSVGAEIRFFSYGSSLEPAFGKQTLKITRGVDHLRLDIHDLDGDGRDEIILTIKHGESIRSFVYKYGDKGFSTLWKGNFFIRRLGDELYGQKHMTGEGFRGEVFPLLWGGAKRSDAKELKALKLPPGVNLFDFAFLGGTGGERLVVAYDDKNHINVYNADGIQVWRSEDDAGGAPHLFKRNTGISRPDDELWLVNDRIVPRGAGALFITRKPYVKSAKGFGYKSSTINAIHWNGASVEVSKLISEIKGNIVDFGVHEDKLYVLVLPPFGFDPKKILSGENPFINNLIIYPLKVR